MLLKLVTAAWFGAVVAGCGVGAVGAAVQATANAPANSATTVPAVKQAPPEVRGTWVTTTGNRGMSTPELTAETMRRLRDIGLNVVYIECWKNGYTEYPSEAMEKLVGVSSKTNDAPARLQRDLLLEGTIEAHRNGMLAIGWLEYGFMASYKDTQNELRALAEKEGWVLRNKDGKVVGKQSPFVWLNPLHPKAQQLIIDITLDAVRKYDLDGVQLDDRIAMPTEMGYDDYTRKLYADEHGGKQPPENPKDPAWVQWRADKITAFAKVYAREVRKANPGIIVSVSPAPHPWSLENYACDWPVWTKWTGDERWDEYVPQNYRFTAETTKKSIAEGFKFIGDRRGDLIAGVRLVGDGPDMPKADVTAIADWVREQKLGGIVWWFSRGVLDVFPETLRTYYNVAELGQAPHPARPADWRPGAVVAKPQAGGSEWTAEVKAAGKYRVIARSKADGRWREVEVRTLQAGPVKLTAGDAEAVELLIDRRP